MRSRAHPRPLQGLSADPDAPAAADGLPDESTADLFFDEEQFEAYRELGYRIAETVFRKDPADPTKTLVKKDLLERLAILEQASKKKPKSKKGKQKS